MRIGIVDADLLDKGTRHPNLALMKISGYHKSLNDTVELITSYNELDNFDKIYISKVFTYTKIPEEILNLPNITIGGTGFYEDGGPDLPYEIEHHKPDYSLYNSFVEKQISSGSQRTKYSDYLDFSIGFTTRGCFRKCEFCVNKKYDHAFAHSPVTEFLDESRPFIYLWDDNFLAFPQWEKILDELEATGKPFQFRQGLDIRLMTDKKANRLSKTRYHGDFIFAFDHIEDRETIERALKLWRRYTNKTTKLYLLCAYDSQDITDIENTFERIKILMGYGCIPYIMRYEDYKTSEFRSLYTQLARWCNQPQFFKKKSFRQFCEANQEVHKNSSTTCAAYQALLDFERDYPEIAKKYVDLRFDQENRYSVSYGFGRKYAHKRDCTVCIHEQNDWVDAYLSAEPPHGLFCKYFSQEVDLQCLTYIDSTCSKQKDAEAISDWFCHQLIENLTWDNLYEIIKQRKNPEPITQANITQYSNLEDAILQVPYHIYEGGRDLTYVKMGYFLDGKNKNDIAKRKYGENHAKFATQLDLAVVSVVDSTYLIRPSIFGRSYNKISDISQKKELAAKLMFRIPIIQELFIDAEEKFVFIEDYLKPLSKTTQTRRRSNISEMVRFISEMSDTDSKIHQIAYNILDKREEKCPSEI